MLGKYADALKYFTSTLCLPDPIQAIQIELRDRGYFVSQGDWNAIVNLKNQEKATKQKS